MFKLKHYVQEIARTGSFSQAAANLYVSQPSLSASIKRLEERIGEPLFHRDCHPITLTRCGEEYLRAARRIDMAEEDFTAFLEEYRSCAAGKLVIGGSNLNISFVLPVLLERFVREYPGIDLELVEGNIAQLQQLLLEGRVDLVMDSCEMDPQHFCSYLYKDEHLILAVPAAFPCNAAAKHCALRWEDIRQNRHRAADMPALPLALLADVPFISMTPETDTYQRVRLICAEAGFTPSTILSFSQQSTAFNMACAGLGFTFISDTLVKNARFRPDLVFYKIGSPESFRHIKVFVNASRRMSYAVKAFLEIAK